MKERGIIFNGDMVRAILSGQKTQTRRVMRVQPGHPELGLRRIVESSNSKDTGKYFWSQSGACGSKVRSKTFSCPFGKIGDRLWVREAFSLLGNEDSCPIDWLDNLVKGGGTDAARIYRASCEQKPGDYGLWSIPDDADWKPHTDDMKFEGAWTPSIHMPRWASRISLEITGVRVERLNDISEQDAIAEGFTSTAQLTASGDDYTGLYASDRFADAWQSIYGAESWNANPWCWAITFRRIKGD